MTVIRLELDVPEDKVVALAVDLPRLLAQAVPGLETAWSAARVTILSDFDVQREQTLLAAARYFYPLWGGGS